MPRSFVVNEQEVPWSTPRTHTSGGIRGSSRNKFIGDEKLGPWVSVAGLEPGYTVSPHSHTADEVIIILEGSMRVGDKECNAGSILYVEKNTPYGLTVGPKGCKFINVRSGHAETNYVKG